MDEILQCLSLTNKSEKLIFMRTAAQFFTIVFLMFFLPTSCQKASAYFQQDVVKNISIALGKGDASAIAVYFPNSVGISILQKVPVYYSEKQGEQILKDFFSKNKPRKFEKAHAGGQNSAQFTMGDLTTTTGVYRVTFFLKNVGGKAFIQNLIIDKK